MADHQEMIHAAAASAALYRGATRSSTTQASHGGDWWSTAVSPPVSSCSPEMPGFGAWSAAAAAGRHVDGVDGNRSRSSNTASSESPGSNSLATGSSITFQEPTGVADPATIAVLQTAAAGFATGWSQSFLDGSGFHGYMCSRSDQNHINKPSLMSPTPSSSNNNSMLQDSHDQNYQFLSNLGFELLSSPTSPYGGFRSSLMRSLTEPAVSAAVAKPNSPGFQQYQRTMNEAPEASIRQPLQFTNHTPFWNPSTGFATAVDGAALGAARPPPVRTRPASLAAKSALGVGDSSSVITKKANADPTPLRKARTGTPSPLPTFKVRKEKLGDRITALQQLLSPFGKTDTASVLHETIEYIKFLHEQVGAHSAPYLKNRPQQVPHLKSSTDKSKDGGEAAVKRDLTGGGLCLVPISSTFAVASETPVDFWTRLVQPFGSR